MTDPKKETGPEVHEIVKEAVQPDPDGAGKGVADALRTPTSARRRARPRRASAG